MPLRNPSHEPLLQDLLPKFYGFLGTSPNLTPPVCAVQVLVDLLVSSGVQTMSEMSDLLTCAGEILGKDHKFAISASAGCTLFARYATKMFAREPNFYKAQDRLVRHGRQFIDSIDTFRDLVARVGCPFISEGANVLIHSHSRAVMKLLELASSEGKNFNVFVTEGRPSEGGRRASAALHSIGISAQLILDAAVAYAIQKMDLVLVGAEGVVETGGILNHMGTYQIAIVAREKKKPMYVVAESYKFVRHFPLDQYDMGIASWKTLACVPENDSPQIDAISARHQYLDYTPPEYITLLFTEKGVLTPSAVSDELIKVFN